MLVIDDMMRLVGAADVAAAHDRQIDVLGLTDPAQGLGRRFLEDLRVDQIAPASLAPPELADLVRSVGPRNARSSLRGGSSRCVLVSVLHAVRARSLRSPQRQGERGLAKRSSPLVKSWPLNDGTSSSSKPTRCRPCSPAGYVAPLAPGSPGLLHGPTGQTGLSRGPYRGPR